MILITEDSTAGYKIWRQIINRLAGKNIKVICCNGSGSVYKYLATMRQQHEIVITIVDRMLDETMTAKMYENILNLSKSKDNILVPLYGSFERQIITYDKLDRLVNKSGKIRQMVQDIRSNSSQCGIIYKQKLVGDYWNKYNGINSEQTYKGVLQEYTNNTSAFIYGNSIGPCWIKNCNSMDNNACNTCTVYSNGSISCKTADLMVYQEICLTLNDLNSKLDKIVLVNYVPDKYDSEHKRQFDSTYDRLNILQKNIMKMLCYEKHGKWSYTLLMNDIQRGVIK